MKYITSYSYAFVSRYYVLFKDKHNYEIQYEIQNEILRYIASYGYTSVNQYYVFLKNKHNYKTQKNKYLYFCYDVFYKKYASILSNDIAKIIKKVL